MLDKKELFNQQLTNRWKSNLSPIAIFRTSLFSKVYNSPIVKLNSRACALATTTLTIVATRVRHLKHTIFNNKKKGRY